MTLTLPSSPLDTTWPMEIVSSDGRVRHPRHRPGEVSKAKYVYGVVPWWSLAEARASYKWHVLRMPQASP